MTANCLSHAISAKLVAVGDTALFTLPADGCPVPTAISSLLTVLASFSSKLSSYQKLEHHSLILLPSNEISKLTF